MYEGDPIMPRVGARPDFGIIVRLGDPEIGHLGEAVLGPHEDVAGLQIAVDHPFVVRCRNAMQDHAEQSERLFEG